MTNQFFNQPILNSPYAYPTRHWELDDRQSTDQIIATRRAADFMTPMPKLKLGRIAVKGINHLGDDAMKVFSVG